AENSAPAGRVARAADVERAIDRDAGNRAGEAVVIEVVVDAGATAHVLQRDRDRVLARADRQLELAGIVGRQKLAIEADHDPVAVRAKRLVAEEAAAADTHRDLVARVDRKG